MQLVLLDLDSCNFKVVCVYQAAVHKGSIRAVYADAINVIPDVFVYLRLMYILCIPFAEDWKKREKEKGGCARFPISCFPTLQHGGPRANCADFSVKKKNKTERFIAPGNSRLRTMCITIDRGFFPRLHFAMARI